ncbi:MAG: PAS domain S-box protein [Patescibacteria group bacterium]
MLDREKKYEDILKEIMDVYFFTDNNGILVDVSESVCNFYGVSNIEEIIGKQALDFYAYPSDRDKLLKLLKKSSKVKTEITLKNSKGDHIITEVHAHNVFDASGNKIGIEGTLRNITEQKQSEERFRIAATLATDLIYEWNPYTDEIKWFGDIEKALGYKKGELPIRNNELKSLLHPDEVDNLYHNIDSYKYRKEPFHDEYRIRHANGNWCYWIEKGLPVIDANGHVKKWIGVCSDVTEKKKAEKDLRDSERKFRNLFENESDALTIMDAETLNFEDANKASLDLYGYTKEEYLKLNALDMTAEPRKTLKSIKKNIRRLKWKRIPFRYHRKKDGVVFPVEITSGVFVWKGRKKIIGAVRDITERLKAEQALKNSEARFRSVFENASTGMNITDPQGRYLDVNEAFCQMVGYAAEELKQKKFHDITFPADLAADLRMFNQLLANEIPSYQLEKRYIRQDGHLVWVDLNVSLVKDHSGRPIHFIGQVIDITEKKKAEEKLIEAQKMDSIGNLAGGIAHDFNNMLSGILGHASILQIEENDATKLESIQGIISTAERASDLTSKLLAFGRRGKNLVQATEVNKIVKEVLMILKHSINKSIKITTDLEKNLYSVDADPSQINQLLMNLCVNAAEAMPDGGTMVIHTHNVTFERSYLGLPPGEYVYIRVTDTGYGMSEETRRQIFDPFFTTKTKGEEKGTGLGLSTAYGIVKSHYGMIDVYTELEQGSTFRVYLPKGKLTLSQNNTKEDQITNQTGTVLVVDDEKLITEMMTKMLDKMGYEVIAATNGLDGVNIYREKYHQIDVVILDMQMRDMSGKETFIHMKEINPHVRVLLSTGYGRNEEAQEILNLGVIDLLPKPYKMDELQKKISRLMI